MPKKKTAGLGRGLDAIFLDNSLEERALGSGNTVSNLRMSMIDPKSDQPRKYFDPIALEELADSIRRNGVLQPILVREYGDGRYQILAGERRFRAAKLAELSEIPAIVLDKDDLAAMEISIIENIQREDLNPIEEALAYKALIEGYGFTQEELACRVGKSRSAVANAMRLADLPDEVVELVSQKKLSAAHARTLLALKDENLILPTALRVIEADMSVRALENEVKRLNKLKPTSEEDEQEPLPIVNYVRELELRVQSHLGRRVKIEERPRKKTITLYYEDNEDLDDLLCQICGKDFSGED